MTYVGILIYQGQILFVNEGKSNQVRLFEDESLANDVVNVFKEDSAIQGAVISYDVYVKLLNHEISPEEIFTQKPVASAEEIVYKEVTEGDANVQVE